MYVSKYIAKTFENRRAEDKGMRLVGCSKRVAKVCNERFSWANGAGSLWRTKLGMVAEMLRFDSSDDFARSLGPKWAYHLKPVIELLSLPYYGSMKLARADGGGLFHGGGGGSHGGGGGGGFHGGGGGGHGGGGGGGGHR